MNNLLSNINLNQSFHFSILLVLLVTLVLLVILSYSQFIIFQIKKRFENINISSVRLYLFLMLILSVLTISFWYLDINIVNLADPVIPYIFYILLVSVLFNFRISLATTVLTSIMIVYFCFEPRYFIFTEKSLTTILFTLGGLSGSLVSGLLIRSYHRQLLANLIYLRGTLNRVGQERSILEHIYKATLAISSTRLNLNNILKIMVEESAKLIGSDFVGVFIYRGKHFPLIVQTYYKGDELKLNHQKSLLFSEIMNNVSGKMEPFLLNISKISNTIFNNPVFNNVENILVAPIVISRKPIGFLFLTKKGRSIVDISDRKKLKLFADHAALAIDNAEHHNDLKILVKARDQLSSVVAHELKTPLSTIKLCSDLVINQLKKSGYSQSAIDKLKNIDRESDKITMLANSLLDFSRLLTGKLKLNLEIFNLTSLCLEKIAIMRSLYPEHFFEFNDLHNNLIVKADKLRIDQVLTNLINNAVKYSKPTSTVTLMINSQSGDVLITVKDQGQGIPKNKLKVIFEPFYQLQGRGLNKSNNQGLGLGLFITKEIVFYHHGKIWCQSKEGKGTSFYVNLPKNIIDVQPVKYDNQKRPMYISG